MDATLRHVDLIADRMRRADRAEVRASGNLSPREAVLASFEISEFVRTAFIESEPLCMFGVVVGEGCAYPWLLTTDLVDRYPLTFWRASKKVLAEVRGRYPVLVQQIDARYSQALNWARRLGFEVATAAPFGVNGMPFHRISIGGP